MKAFEASQTGTAEYRVAMEEWQEQRAQDDETDEHKQQTLESLVSVNSIDAGLVELIRAELHAGASSEPEPVLPTGSASDADSQNRGKRPNWLRARTWAGTRSGDARL